MFKNWNKIDWSKKLGLLFLLFVLFSLFVLVISTLTPKSLRFSSAQKNSNIPLPGKTDSIIQLLSIDKTGKNVRLVWNYEGKPGVKYKVYRSRDPYFEPFESNLVGETRETYYNDEEVAEGMNYFYTVSLIRGNDEEFTGSYLGVWNWDISMTEEGWVHVVNPFLNFKNNIHDVLGTQLYGSTEPLKSDRVLVWNPIEKRYASSWFCSGEDCESWGDSWYNKWLSGNYAESEINIPMGRPFMLQRRGGFEEKSHLTFTGFLPEFGGLTYDLKYVGDPSWYFISVPMYRSDIVRVSDLVEEMPYALEFTTWDKELQKYLCFVPASSDAYCSDTANEVDFSLEPLQAFWVRISSIDTTWPQ